MSGPSLRFHVVRLYDLPADPVAMFARQDDAYQYAADLNDTIQDRSPHWVVLDAEPPTNTVRDEDVVLTDERGWAAAAGGVLPVTDDRVDGCIVPGAREVFDAIEAVKPNLNLKSPQQIADELAWKVRSADVGATQRR